MNSQRGWAGRSYAAIVRLLFRRRDEADVAEVERDAQQLLVDAQVDGRVRLCFVWIALTWDATSGALRHDFMHGVRALIRTPRFTLIAASLLGVGVAVTTTLFALINAAFLRPLPFADPDRLVMVWETSRDRPKEGPSPQSILDWRARASGVQALTAWMTTRATLWTGESSIPLTGAQVTLGFFDVFRAPPLMGRTFREDEYRGAARSANAAPGSPVVIGHALWIQLGAPPEIVGQQLRLDGNQFRVIGVMRREFSTPHSDAVLWTPWDMTMSYRAPRFPAGLPRDFRFLMAAARLEEDVGVEVAGERLRMAADDIARAHPETNAGWSVRVVPLSEEFGSGRPQLVLLFASVVCLLTLVCANFAGLALTRAFTRARDLAIRTALGASRGRLVRQLAAEGVVLAGLSTVVGVVLTALWLDAAVALAPRGFPRLNEVTLDWRVFMFAAIAACFVGIVAGLVPGLSGTTLDVVATLKDGSLPSGSRRASSRRLLVTGELAITLLLLIVAGLLVRHFETLRRVDLGFDPSKLLVLRVSPDPTRYTSKQQTRGYYGRLLDELRGVPGVASAAAVTSLPLSGVGPDFDRPFWRQGARVPPSDAPKADIRMATPRYFATLRRPVLGGREFDEGDHEDAPRVVIVNEALARGTWPDVDPIGQSVMIDYLGGVYDYRVVGLVRDARHHGPRGEPRPEIFIPHAQNPYLFMNVVIRTTAEPTTLVNAARDAARRTDPAQPLHSVTTMTTLTGAAVEQDRASTVLVLLFALAGAAVAFTGVYALCSATVAARHRELAVMIAIGASEGTVKRMIIGEACSLAVAGALIGIAAALASGRAIATFLFGVPAHDPWTIGLTTLILFGIVVAATWPAASRAARTDPIVALRS